MEIEKKSVLKVEAGVVSVQFEAGLDQDQDGVKSVEAGAYMKINVSELLQEIGKSKDQASLVAIAAFIEANSGILPKIEKEL